MYACLSSWWLKCVYNNNNHNNNTNNNNTQTFLCATLLRALWAHNVLTYTSRSRPPYVFLWFHFRCATIISWPLTGPETYDADLSCIYIYIYVCIRFRLPLYFKYDVWIKHSRIRTDTRKLRAHYPYVDRFENYGQNNNNIRRLASSPFFVHIVRTLEQRARRFSLSKNFTTRIWI